MYTKNELKLAEKNGTIDRVYADMVDTLIRREYTASDETALARHMIAGNESKRDDWERYNAYAEECKNEAQKMIEELLK